MQATDYADILEKGMGQLLDFRYQLAARKLIEAARNGEFSQVSDPNENLDLVWISLREKATDKRATLTIGREALDRYLAKLDTSIWEIEDIDRQRR